MPVERVEEALRVGMAEVPHTYPTPQGTSRGAQLAPEASAAIAHERCTQAAVCASEVMGLMSREARREFAKVVFRRGFASKVEVVERNFYIGNVLSVLREFMVRSRESSVCDAWAAFSVAQGLASLDSDVCVLSDYRNSDATVALAVSLTTLRDMLVGTASFADRHELQRVKLGVAVYNERTSVATAHIVGEIMRDISWIDTVHAGERLCESKMDGMRMAVSIIGEALLGACIGSSTAADIASCVFVVDFAAGVVGSSSRISSLSVRGPSVPAKERRPYRLRYLRILAAMNLRTKMRLRSCAGVASLYADVVADGSADVVVGDDTVSRHVIGMVSRDTGTDVACALTREAVALRHGEAAIGKLIHCIVGRIVRLVVVKWTCRWTNDVVVPPAAPYVHLIRRLLSALKAVAAAFGVGDGSVPSCMVRLLDSILFCLLGMGQIGTDAGAETVLGVRVTTLGALSETVLGILDAVRCVLKSSAGKEELQLFLKDGRVENVFRHIRAGIVPVVGERVELAVGELEGAVTGEVK